MTQKARLPPSMPSRFLPSGKGRSYLGPPGRGGLDLDLLSHRICLLRQSIPWPRVFAEGVIIVVSILLAFAIDAAWESRQASEWRRQTLADLVREAEANRAALQEFIALSILKCRNPSKTAHVRSG